METFSTLPPVTSGFPSQRDSNMDLWCFFVVSLNKLLNKHSIDQLFRMPWQSFDVTVMIQKMYFHYRWIFLYWYMIQHVKAQWSIFTSMKRAQLVQMMSWRLFSINSSVHHLNKCWLLIKWPIIHKLWWNMKQNPTIFIQENAFANFISIMPPFIQASMCYDKHKLCPMIYEYLPTMLSTSRWWANASGCGSQILIEIHDENGLILNSHLKNKLAWFWSMQGSTLQLWILQCQWHWSTHSCSVEVDLHIFMVVCSRILS